MYSHVSSSSSVSMSMHIHSSVVANRIIIVFDRLVFRTMRVEIFSSPSEMVA